MGSVIPLTLWIQPWIFLRATPTLKGYTQDMPVESQVQERRGEAFELGQPLTVIGRKLQPGEPAPPFTLECFDPALEAITIVRLADSDGQVRLLNVVNSLDTPVCDVETQKWEERRAELPADVQLLTISMDLPFAQARWCEAAEVRHQALSAHRDEQFGRDYGVLIKEWRVWHTGRLLPVRV